MLSRKRPLLLAIRNDSLFKDSSGDKQRPTDTDMRQDQKGKNQTR
jgi:hypothetical protein